jgi:hypothetical protein
MTFLDRWRNPPRIDIPKFGEPIQNQTIPVGREAVFSCVVDNLQTYKVSCRILQSHFQIWNLNCTRGENF